MEEATLPNLLPQDVDPVTLEDVPGFFEKLINTLYDFAVTYGLRLVAAVLLLIVGFKISGWIVRVYKRSKLYERLDPTVRTFLRSVLSITCKLIVVLSAAAIMGIPMSSMIALVTSAGLTIGLALQGGLSNIAGGFIIMVFKPFAVGDHISFDNYEGIVKSISLFYTKIITFDNRQIMVPNSTISNDILIDNSALPTRRIDVPFSVSYDSDIDAVRQAILAAAQQEPTVLDIPAPQVLLEKQNESSVDFLCRFYCKTERYWEALYAVNERIKRTLDENSIQIPYPQMDVHIKQ